MSSVEALATALRSETPVFSAWCGLPEPAVAGILAREPGYGCVVVDMQHGMVDALTAIRAIPLVAAAGKPCLPRIPVGDFATASRLLDAGASGIIAPMINTVEDARAFASATKYPPVGGRSWGPHAALPLSGRDGAGYFTDANGISVTFAMIETREALGGIDDILAVDGIDAIFIGPFDLSIALSNGSAIAPDGDEVNRAIDHALVRARAAGKRAGIYAASGERARHFAGLGFDLVAIGSDTAFMSAGAASMLAAATA
ncbi:HpcH/HpaI aldolase/citrate lyase family protein [uncultured Enterovirga sp.]|uniref:HpcH/HpaI aldolase family protein n=1 Tax=uncultured Enterovirga sp. TaxID=2026352 RepID=UPI0035CAE013